MEFKCISQVTKEERKKEKNLWQCNTTTILWLKTYIEAFNDAVQNHNLSWPAVITQHLIYCIVLSFLFYVQVEAKLIWIHFKRFTVTSEEDFIN